MYYLLAIAITFTIIVTIFRYIKSKGVNFDVVTTLCTGFLMTMSTLMIHDFIFFPG
jgi:hypothetical protein